MNYLRHTVYCTLKGIDAGTDSRCCFGSVPVLFGLSGSVFGDEHNLNGHADEQYRVGSDDSSWLYRKP